MFIDGIQLIRFHPQPVDNVQENPQDTDSTVVSSTQSSTPTKTETTTSDDQQPKAQPVKVERLSIGSPLKAKKSK